jgi:alpha-1,6-mannosyltransferase
VRFCDLTFAYTAASGGIRTYLDQKRAWFLAHTPHEHVMIVPAEETSVERAGRAITYRLASPLIPGCEPYRFFCRPGMLLDALRETAPDVVELGSFYLEPWVAFRYRKEMAELGRRCVIGGYFHTDLAGAYFGAPVRAALGAQLAPWSEHAAALGAKLGDLIEAGATGYFGGVFKRCDRMFAASAAQAARLAGYGVDAPQVVPLGVDLQRFHPRHRSADTRAKHGAGPRTTLLVFAGRLDREKRVHVLLEAFERWRAAETTAREARLVLLGEGPLRGELEARAAALDGAVSVLPFERDPAALATLLASADIYATAGPHETFGLSVIEAQASGLPVVGVRSGALLERVVERTGLLGPVDDADAMAKNFALVAMRVRELGANARRHVERGGFGWEATFARLLAAYGEELNAAATANRRLESVRAD